VLALEPDRAIQRLRARIRAESGIGASPWSRSQLQALDRLVTAPPMTTSNLAATEYVRPQSMAATLAPLLDAGLLIPHRDPDDGRRVLLVVADSGRDACDRCRHSATPGSPRRSGASSTRSN
jgi:DNA-binding MarR family transcriptional regulator